MNEQARPGPPKTSALAILSVFFGFLGLICALPVIGSVLAFVFGPLALVQIGTSEGRIVGQRHAVVGMIFGILGLATNYFMFSLLMQAKSKGTNIRCVSNVHQIGVAITFYAEDHNGRIPREFSDLRPYLPNLDKVLICPAASDTNHYSYELVDITNKWGEGPKFVILQEIAARHDGCRTVLFDDGHVEQVPYAR
jgi:hypothetical protein